MRELPDVQVYKELLDSTSLHRTVVTVSADEGRELQVSPSTLRRCVRRIVRSKVAGPTTYRCDRHRAEPS